MLANAILSRTANSHQPNKFAVKIMADYIYDNCTGRDLVDFFNMGGVILGTYPKKIIKNLLTNRWDTIRQNQAMIIYSI